MNIWVLLTDDKACTVHSEGRVMSRGWSQRLMATAAQLTPRAGGAQTAQIFTQVVATSIVKLLTELFDC
jgi:hypothetical protein